jgi:hypothetical protein
MSLLTGNAINFSDPDEKLICSNIFRWYPDFNGIGTERLSIDNEKVIFLAFVEFFFPWTRIGSCPQRRIKTAGGCDSPDNPVGISRIHNLKGEQRIGHGK